MATLVERTEAQMAALRLRLEGLEGKEHKRERTAVNKELYNLENDEAYVAAAKEERSAQRAADTAAEDVAWQASMQRERDAAEASKQRPASSTAETPEERLHFRSLVTSLFDEYATTFEAELHALSYRAPAKIEAALSQIFAPDTAFSSTLAVDLGCGTGLAGVALRSRCHGRLVGCDLSQRMLNVAAQKHTDVYDELHACDCVAFLTRHVAPAAADLMVAADVLVYMRELTDLFRAAASRLAPGGLFAFSTELASPDEDPDGPGWIERASERIAHSEAYVRMVVAEAGDGEEGGGLEVVELHEASMRNDLDKPIRGMLVVVRKTLAGGPRDS